MDSMRFSRELRATLAGWGAVLGDVLEGGPPDEALQWLLRCLASELEGVVDAMRRDGLAALAERVGRRRYQAEHPEAWCDGVAWEEEDADLTPATRAARHLADNLARDGEEWARVYEALHQEEILQRARGTQPVES
jgi:hypothetical protein